MVNKDEYFRPKMEDKDKQRRDCCNRNPGNARGDAVELIHAPEQAAAAAAAAIYSQLDAPLTARDFSRDVAIFCATRMPNFVKKMDVVSSL